MIKNKHKNLFCVDSVDWRVSSGRESVRGRVYVLGNERWRACARANEVQIMNKARVLIDIINYEQNRMRIKNGIIDLCAECHLNCQLNFIHFGVFSLFLCANDSGFFSRRQFIHVEIGMVDEHRHRPKKKFKIYRTNLCRK